MFKKHKIITLALIFGGLILFSTFYDLQVTQLVVNRSSLFGQFFYMFGELPGTFVGLSCFAILTTSYTKDIQKDREINIIFFGLLTIIVGFAMSFQLIKYLKLELFSTLFIGLFISMGLIYTTNQLSDEKKEQIRIYAWVGVLTFTLGILISNLIKIVWARPRYRIFNGDDSLFRAWYISSGFTLDDNWKSFPSGHSAAATISLVYLYLPKVFDKLKGKEGIILAVCVTWISLVMFSRVVIGDHFMSDTLFGTGITLLIFMLLNKLLINNKKGIK